MTIHLVTMEQVTHTCPAQPEPHPYDIRRTLIHTIPGGGCRTPVTITCGTVTTQIPCGRIRPRDEQFPACRVIVTEHTITTLHLDHEAG